jgi:hypothetical protein
MAVSISAADPTVIDFSGLIGTVGDYGMVPAGYGSFAANTPDIGVYYSTNCGPSTSEVWVSYVSFWQGEYGDLPAVAYPTTNGFYAVISLAPDPGYEVTLDSFLIAGYPTGDCAQPGQSISVEDGSFQSYPGASYLSYTVQDSGDYLFTPDITSTGTLNIVFGPSWNIGINDITFGEQFVGLPDAANSAFILGAAFLALACLSKVFTGALPSR